MHAYFVLLGKRARKPKQKDPPMKLYLLSALFFCSLIGCQRAADSSHTSQAKEPDSDSIAVEADTNVLLSTIPMNDQYSIIRKNDSLPGAIDRDAINRLSAPYKAVAAFYAALAGSLCEGDSCGLTTALGLGKQGSALHQTMIKKYFPNDKLAMLILTQECALPPSGASCFSEYEYLTLGQKGDTCIVDYNLMSYVRGDSKWTHGPDIYLWNGHDFHMLQRNVYKYVEKE
jgi:hypothetical protein